MLPSKCTITIEQSHLNQKNLRCPNLPQLQTTKRHSADQTILSLSVSITRITCHTKPHVTFHFHKKQIQHDTQKTACCLLIVLVVSRVNCPLDERNERNQHSLHRAQPEFTKHWQNPNTFVLLFHWVRQSETLCFKDKSWT